MNFKFYKRVFSKTLYDYVDNSQINGFHYLKRGVTTGLGRIFWIILLNVMLVFGFILSFLTWNRFQTDPTQVTIGVPKKPHEVPFPAITVCHPQTVMDYKVERFLPKLKLPDHISRAEIAEKLLVLAKFTEPHFERFNITPDALLIDEVFKFNNLTVLDGINELGTVKVYL